jgi:hypothetical protein
MAASLRKWCFVLVLVVVLVGALTVCGWDHWTEDRLPVSILMVGNSYTMPMPAALQALADSAGWSVRFEQETHGGWTLQQHAQSMQTIERIRSERWDYVVLQEQSQIPSLPIRETMMYPAVRSLDAIIRENGSKTVLFMTWGRRDGDLQNDPDDTFEAMTERLRQGYMEIGLEVGALVVPVGLAWRLAHLEAPEMNLWNKDGSHPSPRGVYLTACTFFAYLLDRDLSEVDWDGGLPGADAAFLRATARQAAIDRRIE